MLNGKECVLRVLDFVGTGVQNSNCIKLFFYKLYNIEHWTYISLSLSIYIYIYIRSLSYIVFD